MPCYKIPCLCPEPDERYVMSRNITLAVLPKLHWTTKKSNTGAKMWSVLEGKILGPPEINYQYVIQEVNLALEQFCYEAMYDYLLENEPLCQCLGLKEDDASMNAVIRNIKYVLSQKVSMICVPLHRKDIELAAFNLLVVKSVKDKWNIAWDREVGNPWINLLKIMIAMEGKVDVYAHYKVKQYIMDYGMTVNPAHRRRNIALEMMKAREHLCRHYEIDVVAMMCLTKVSQKLATTCGYEVLATMPYAEMVDHGVDVTMCGTESAMIMARRYDLTVPPPVSPDYDTCL